MKLDIALNSRHPYDHLAEVCKSAEETGFAGLWNAENAHDAFLPLALVATQTRRVEMGTKIAVAFARSPMSLAYIAWDLQNLSRGRLIMGLGTQVKGHIERRFNMPWDSPAPRMKEFVQALRTIWACWQDRKPLDFQGRFYKFSLMPEMYTPQPIEHPRIPVYISAVNKYMCRVVGEVCDGIHLHPFNTARHTREVILPEIEAGARRAGRSLKDITLCLTVLMATGRTTAELHAARDQVRRMVAFYASTRTYAPFMEFHGWGELVPRLHKLSLEGKWDDMSRLIPDEMPDAIGIVAPPGELAARVNERYRGLASRLALDVDFLRGLDIATSRHLLKELA